MVAGQLDSATKTTERPTPSYNRDDIEALETRDLPFGVLFPKENSTVPTTGLATLSLTPFASIQAVERYYAHDDCKYRGTDTESLYRHVGAFRALCTRLGIHRTDRATCVPASLGPSRHNLPSLCHDNATKSQDDLWTLIPKRVYTAARMTRLRTLWQCTRLASFPRTPGDNDIQHSGRLVEYLKQLQ